MLPETQTNSIALPVQLIPLVGDYLSGASMDNLATKYNLSISEVSDFLNRKEVRQYIKTELANYKYTSRKRRIDLLSRIVDEQIEFAEENEMPLSKKDIVEILKLLREENKDIENLGVVEDQGDNAKNQYINIINQLKA